MLQLSWSKLVQRSRGLRPRPTFNSSKLTPESDDDYVDVAMQCLIRHDTWCQYAICRSRPKSSARAIRSAPKQGVQPAAGLLGVQSLQSPQVVSDWVEGILLHLHRRASLSVSTAGQQQLQQQSCAPTDNTAVCNSSQAVHSSLQFISACHPNSSWQAAAQAALQQLSSTTVYIETAAAAAAAKHRHTAYDPPDVGAAAGQEVSDSTRSGQQQQERPDSVKAAGALQQLVQHAAQLEDWVNELRDLQAATAAAATAISLDADCAPVLLLDAAAAQQHPIWAQDYAAFSNAATSGTAAATRTSKTLLAAAAAATAASDLRFVLPAESDLMVGGGASLDIGQHYSTAAAAGSTPRQQFDQPPTSSSSSQSSESVCMPWPLTAAASKVLLSSPLGLLPDHQLRQVYSLGVVGRCGALADAVDLARLVGAELATAQVEQQQLGQQLTQQLMELHSASQAGAAVDTVLLAAAASAAATTRTELWAPAADAAAGADSASGSAVCHPAVAMSFLQDLAAFGRTCAAGELQSWLVLCQQDATLRSYLEASGALQQLPTDAADLQLHQLDALRETVAVAQANRGMSGARPVGQAPQQKAMGAAGSSSNELGRQSDSQEWLQDYTDMSTLLPGVCSVLGDCLQLYLHCSAAACGSTWCEEAYLITVSDQQHTTNNTPQSNSGNSSTGSSSQPLRGYVWLLFDDSYHGMPATHMVSPGVPAAGTHNQPGQAQPMGNPQQQQQQQQLMPGAGLSQLLGNLQATTVAVTFPKSFCSQDSGIAGGSSSSGNGSGGRSSSFSVLQSLLHELGHALHFLLSASAAADPTAAGGHQSSLEVMETASHLLERIARNATCLQAMLRHRVTKQPPHPALIQQLLTYNSISTRGVHQWHQHVLAALTDSILAAQSAAVQSEQDPAVPAGSCSEVLSSVTRQYNALAVQSRTELVNAQCPACEGVSSAMLEYLPALAVLQPGDMYCYICADLVAAALWGKHLGEDPLDPAAWCTLRQKLFEPDARINTAAVFESLLGPGSMQQLTVQLMHSVATSRLNRRGLGSGAANQVTGWVPKLGHPCFQDIDLWG